MIAKGSTEISKVCLGSDELSKVCLGDDVIWTAEQGMRYVQYIESTGTQYLETGMTPTSTSEFIVDADFVKYANDDTFFSASTNWSFSQLTLFWSGQNWYFAVKNAPFKQNFDRYIYKVVGSTIYVDDVQKVTNYWYNSYVNTTLKIFCHGSKSRNSGGKLYGSTFKDNGTLLQNLVPVAIGNVGYMLDTISGNLFGDANGGYFTPGPDVV